VSTFGAGNAGSLTVRAKDIEVTGATADSPSALVAASTSTATGNGGNLLIETQHLRVANGGQIATSTAGAGNAGSLTVRASDVELIGTTDFGRSGLFSSAIAGTGNGGNLTVATNRLVVRDGATISVSNFSSRNPDIPAGRGAAGNLNVQANSILLDKQGILTAEAAVGNRGNINLQSNNILLRRGSAITTNAQGTATGGNITIETDTLAAFENSDITANAQQSFGGRVSITAQGIFGIAFREQLTPASDITASSELGAEFNGVVELNTPDADPSRGLVELPNVLAPSTQVVAACRKTERSEFVITGRGGLPEAPTQTIRDSTVWEDLRLAARRGEDKSNIAEKQNKLPPSSKQPASSSPPPSAIVEAQGWIVDTNGQVMLVAGARSVPNQPWNQPVQCQGQVD
jgi:large exoprotein involved in heme utilization and adhesion